MKSSKGGYYVTVVEDTTTNQVIGAATLVVEQKFIHSLATVGSDLSVMRILFATFNIRLRCSLINGFKTITFLRI